MASWCGRIMFSTDWPFENIDHAADWFDGTPIAPSIAGGLAHQRGWLFKPISIWRVEIL
jgi:predicted TIM-barrel fold metal-dependent hydrolase